MTWTPYTLTDAQLVAEANLAADNCDDCLLLAELADRFETRNHRVVALEKLVKLMLDKHDRCESPTCSCWDSDPDSAMLLSEFLEEPCE